METSSIVAGIAVIGFALSGFTFKKANEYRSLIVNKLPEQFRDQPDKAKVAYITNSKSDHDPLYIAARKLKMYSTLGRLLIWTTLGGTAIFGLIQR